MKKSPADCTEMPFWSLFHRRFCQPESFSIFKSRKEIWLPLKRKKGISEKQRELANNVPGLIKNISTNK